MDSQQSGSKDCPTFRVLDSQSFPIVYKNPVVLNETTLQHVNPRGHFVFSSSRSDFEVGVGARQIRHVDSD